MQHINMKTFITILFLSFTYFWSSAQCVTNLLFKGDTAYDPTNSIIYNGEYREFFPGEIKVKGQYVNGLKSGVFYFYRQRDYRSNFYKMHIDSIVEYSNGEKEGRLIRYNWANYKVSDESYSKGKKNGICYYWHDSGQLYRVATYQDDSITSDTIFKIDSSIYQITYILPFEKSDYMRDENFLNPEDYKSLTSLKIQVVILKFENGYDIFDSGLDTIVSNDFKIKGFVFSGNIFDNDSTSRHIGASYIFKYNDKYSEIILNAIKDSYTPNFWIDEFDIIDKNDIIYRLPTKRYRVRY